MVWKEDTRDDMSIVIGSINNYPNTAEAEELLDKFMTGCSELIRKEEIGNTPCRWRRVVVDLR